MKPHRLSMTAFGPYPDTVDVDFDSLAPHGLFLLQGPTGAGKTSLLDGICFALYGTVPGTRSVKRLRSDHASPGAVCEVTLEATICGRRVRLTRRPEQEQAKKRGEGFTTKPTYVLLEERVGDQWRTLSQRVDEVGEEISRWMGMSADQFAQVVLLPQGRFAQFLQATSDERAKLLEQLFDTHRFRNVEEWLASRRRETTARLEDHERVIADLVARFSEAAGAAAPDDGVVVWAESMTAQAAADVVAARTLEATAQADADARTAQRMAAEAAFEATEHHRQARARIAILEQLSAELSDLRLELDAAKRAEPARALALAAHEATVLARSAQHAREEAIAGLDQDATAPELRDLARDAVARQGVLQSLLPLAAELDAASSEFAVTRAARDKTGRALEVAHSQRVELGGRLVALAEELRAAFTDAQSRLNDARDRERVVREARLAGMGAELAAALVDGDPCPVCGSVEHPTPAIPGHAQVTLDDENAAGSAVRSVEADTREMQVELGVIDVEVAKLPAELNLPLLVGPADSAEDLGSMLTAATESIATHSSSLEVLHERCKAAEIKVEDLRAKLSSAVGEHLDVEGAIEHEVSLIRRLEAAADATEALDAARRVAAKATDTLVQRLDAIGFTSVGSLTAALRDDAWRAGAEQRTVNHGIELELAQRQLAELGETPLGVDLNAAVESESIARGLLRDAQAAVTLASQSTQRLDDLLPLLRHTYAEAEPLREERRIAKELADLAGGEGSNVLRMRLSTYVLAARLEEVAGVASHRLAAMTDGRYTLEHTDERSERGRKSGLGLIVHDAHTGRSRAPSSLSGGETFMASLALALGLAEVVGNESGGNPIEALFVDEGFGTLDEETLEQVMDILDSLREGGRMVGVVSHVPELDRRIQAKIKITRGLAGSTLEVLCA